MVLVGYFQRFRSNNPEEKLLHSEELSGYCTRLSNLSGADMLLGRIIFESVEMREKLTRLHTEIHKAQLRVVREDSTPEEHRRATQAGFLLDNTLIVAARFLDGSRDNQFKLPPIQSEVNEYKHKVT